MDRKNELLMSVLGVFALVIVTVGASYAFFSYSRTGTTTNTVTSGNIEFTFRDERTVNISLDFFVKNENGGYERFSENFKETAFSDEELTEAAEAAGFSVLKRYAELSCSSPESNTQRVYYVLRREY